MRQCAAPPAPAATHPRNASVTAAPSVRTSAAVIFTRISIASAGSRREATRSDTSPAPSSRRRTASITILSAP
jgi:hypothetical protein